MTQRRPLKTTTVKEKKFIKGIVEGKTKRQAAKDAGYTGSPETLSVTASQVLKNPNVQEELAKALDKHGITLDKAIEPVAKALKATKVVIHGDKEDAFAEVVDDIELQLKGHDRAMKLMGINSPTVNINFNNYAQKQRADYDLS